MKSNTALIALATVVVLAAAYWFFFSGTGNQPPLSVTGAPTSSAQAKFETLVGELGPISFNTGIFTDPHFTALVDIATAVAPETFGRQDPLAPTSASSPAPILSAPAPVSLPAQAGAPVVVPTQIQSAPPPPAASSTPL